VNRIVPLARIVKMLAVVRAPVDESRGAESEVIRRWTREIAVPAGRRSVSARVR
jgi:hypothetical protein